MGLLEWSIFGRRTNFSEREKWVLWMSANIFLIFLMVLILRW